jgi:dTDP-4-dehydrorhamnose reductase
LACEGIASWYDFAREVVAAGARRGWNPLVPVRAVSTEDFPRPAARPAYAVLGLARARALGIEMPHWRDALEAYMDAEDGHRDA